MQVERIELVVVEFGQLAPSGPRGRTREGLGLVAVGDLLERHDGEVVVPADALDGQPHLLAQPRTGRLPCGPGRACSTAPGHEALGIVGS